MATQSSGLHAEFTCCADNRDFKRFNNRDYSEILVIMTVTIEWGHCCRAELVAPLSHVISSHIERYETLTQQLKMEPSDLQKRINAPFAPTSQL